MMIFEAIQYNYFPVDVIFLMHSYCGKGDGTQCF